MATRGDHYDDPYSTPRVHVRARRTGVPVVGPASTDRAGGRRTLGAVAWVLAAR